MQIFTSPFAAVVLLNKNTLEFYHVVVYAEGMAGRLQVRELMENKRLPSVLPAWVLRENAEARTPFGELLHDLADAAMSVNHHDIGEDEPEYIHETEAMKRRFRPILRSYFAAMRVTPKSGRKPRLDEYDS